MAMVIMTLMVLAIAMMMAMAITILSMMHGGACEGDSYSKDDGVWCMRC